MKKILFILILLSILGAQTTLANNFIETKINGSTLRAIEFETDSTNYKIKFVASSTWGSTMDELMQKNNAISGVNGVFFCAEDYTFCHEEGGSKGAFTKNERYIEGIKYRVKPSTEERAVFAWDIDNNPFIFRDYLINVDREDEIYYGMANFPLLLYEGKNTLEEYYDGGLLATNMMTKGTRNFICSDESGDHIYFGLVYGVNIDGLASTLYDFGCYNALNLDAGASTNFVYNDRYIAGPTTRKITDAIVIERVGLDIGEIDDLSEKLVRAMVYDAASKSKGNNMKFQKILLKYETQLNSARNSFYNAIATDIYKKNIVGELDKVGYKIDMNSLKAQKVILLINKAQKELSNFNYLLNKQLNATK